MTPPTDSASVMSRRRFLYATAASLLTAATVAVRRNAARAAATGAARGPATAAAPAPQTAEPDFRQLDAKIRAAMAQYGIPGVAVGVLAQGREYVQGYGVTNVDYPVPVDGDTLFRIASTTKTVTGTTVMRLVEQGTLDLDAPVRIYLPDFQTPDPAVASRVTLRQLLNHSAGWLGEYYEDTGPGDDARARYAAGMARLPHLTPLGTVFHYNNAAVALAGHVIEAATGSTYERAVQALLLDPLGLTHSRFFSDEIVGFNVAALHDVVDGQPVVEPAFWPMPRSIHPTGGLISSARDLGGPALGLPHGPRARLRAHRAHQLPGRAPPGGGADHRRLGAAAVRRRQQPAGRAARPQPRRAGPVRGPLRPPDNRIRLRGDNGQLHGTETTSDSDTVREFRLAFYREDYVLELDATGQPVGSRADFVRDADGRVAWLRFGARLHQHVG